MGHKVAREAKLSKRGADIAQVACCEFLRLAPAHHYGSISSISMSRSFDQFFLAESRYAKYFETPLHRHERDCLVIFLHGLFHEEFKTRSIDCPAGAILFGRAQFREDCERLESR